MSRSRVLWRWNSKAKGGRRKTTSRRPAKREVASGHPRAYGDFRDLSSAGGGIEALVPPGDTQATTDPEIAEKLAADRADELRDAKRTQVQLGVKRVARLRKFASEHLKTKAATEDVTDAWLSAAERHLKVACEFLGGDTKLLAIRPGDVREYVQHLKGRSNGNGGTFSNGTVRHYLNSLSNLFERAQEQEVVPLGHNPVAILTSKPTPEKSEAEYFEPDQMALVLEAARLYEPRLDDGASPHVHEILATAALTGARKSAVLGLEVRDVSFDRKTVRFRPNRHRRLKTDTSTRTVPLWPQLEAVLREYVFGGEGPKSGLLFPSPRTGKMLHDCRKQFDAVAKKAGMEAGEIRFQKLRHTYTAARIQTTEHGAPVALFTVARELGHSSTRLIERRYGHLLTNRRARSEVVKFRAEDYEEELGERLQALQARS